MSKGRIVAIVIVSIVLIALVALFCIGMNGGFSGWFSSSNDSNSVDLDNNSEEDNALFNFGFGSAKSWSSQFDGTVVEDGRLELDADSITAIDAKWIGGKVKVEFHDSNKILLVQSCSRDIAEDRKLVYRVEQGGKLCLREGKGVRVASSPSTDLTIYLPQGKDSFDDLDFSGVSADITLKNLRSNTDVDVETVSGNIQLENLYAGKDIDLDTVSGEISASGCTAGGDAEINSTSGNISLNGFVAGEGLDLNTVSGSMYGLGVSARELESEAVSGELEIAGSFEQIDASAVSGKVSVQSDITPGVVSISTTSGEVTLTLPETSSGFSVDYSTTSGGFKCAFATTSSGKGKATYLNGGAKFDLSTTSGDIAINSAKVE